MARLRSINIKSYEDELAEELQAKRKKITFNTAAYIAKVPTSRIEFWRSRGYISTINRGKPAYDDLYYEDEVRAFAKTMRSKKGLK